MSTKFHSVFNLPFHRNWTGGLRSSAGFIELPAVPLMVDAVEAVPESFDRVFENYKKYRVTGRRVDLPNDAPALSFEIDHWYLGDVAALSDLVKTEVCIFPHLLRMATEITLAPRESHWVENLTVFLCHPSWKPQILSLRSAFHALFDPPFGEDLTKPVLPAVELLLEAAEPMENEFPRCRVTGKRLDFAQDAPSVSFKLDTYYLEGAPTLQSLVGTAVRTFPDYMYPKDKVALARADGTSAWHRTAPARHASWNLPAVTAPKAH